GAIFLSIAENEENAKPISFMLWLDERQELLPLNETISFEPLAAVGNLENPFILTLGEMVGKDELSEGIWIGEPYPNPFNEQTTVPYFLNEVAEIRFSIYDSRGLLIRPTISIAADKGHNQFSVPKGALVKAVYVLEISLVTKHSLHIRRIKLIAQ
ncbi:MAG: T9SS type A sorting domain-containing protein, partial [Bacteroidia bacterium]|nr:T9SS type A sorting domain-containing protein [Bacteroidia bacterium]